MEPISFEDAAELYGMPVQDVYVAAAEGELPWVTWKNRAATTFVWVEDWLESEVDEVLAELHAHRATVK